MKLYKVLSKSGRACHGGNGRWSLPAKNDDGTWTPGDWMPEIKGELVPCLNGYHLCRKKDLLRWLGETIYEAEYVGEIVKASDKVVVREARLVRKIESWNERTARLFACDCAERVLPVFETKYPNDDQPRQAIRVARQYAEGGIDNATRAAAEDAAWNAAWNAERRWQTNRLLKILSNAQIVR